MSTSELVTLQHLNRKAIIYIRQSTPHQLISNQESLRLQYALRQRAIELGWSDNNIEVIDSDLGITAASAEQRPGFKELLAQVTLGLVGIILSYDVTRLSRNCSDWYPLLDLCGYRGCLIADRDGVYDPSSANGRLLLGLKGQISAVELDAYHKAIKTQQQSLETVERAHSQQIQRLQYQVALAERQFNRVDPDNRLVAAELELRWENALRELKLAQENYAKHQQPQTVEQIPKELKTAFIAIGQKLPELWHSGTLTQVQKKSLLRCLIDKVVIHRVVRDTVRTRIIWKGGDTTTVDLPIPVGSFSEMANAHELENRIIAMSQQGIDDQTIAVTLTTLGYRSPLCKTLLPSTVKTLRLKHHIFHSSSQSHPRHISGYLTVPQVAQSLKLSPHWIYDHIHKGTIAISKDESTGLYLFPDVPGTLEQFQKLKAGLVYNLRF